MPFEIRTDDIAFTKVNLPYGWLGNMSPHPVWFNGRRWRTTEALFQALRFTCDDLREQIRNESSPMGTKMVAKRLKNENAERSEIFSHKPMDTTDMENMRMVLKLKIAQHPELLSKLLNTQNKRIIEDVTSRAGPRHEFWGARKDGELWVGHNHLGVMWMELRGQLADWKNDHDADQVMPPFLQNFTRESQPGP